MADTVEMYEGKPVFHAANSRELSKAVKKFEGKAEAPYVVRWSGKTKIGNDNRRHGIRVLP